MVFCCLESLNNVVKYFYRWIEDRVLKKKIKLIWKNESFLRNYVLLDIFLYYFINFMFIF